MFNHLYDARNGVGLIGCRQQLVNAEVLSTCFHWKEYLHTPEKVVKAKWCVPLIYIHKFELHQWTLIPRIFFGFLLSRHRLAHLLFALESATSIYHHRRHHHHHHHHDLPLHHHHHIVVVVIVVVVVGIVVLQAWGSRFAWLTQAVESRHVLRRRELISGPRKHFHSARLLFALESPTPIYTNDRNAC